MPVSMIVFLVTLIVSCHSLPDGAPESTCSSMEPNVFFHGSVLQDDSAFPYKMTCNLNTQGQIEMTIGDASGGAGIPVFKGLLAQVRRDGQLAGNFVQIDQDYNLRCQGQGVTHRNSTEKTHGSFTVDLSNSGEGGKLQCVATVVESLDVYWVSHVQDLTGVPHDGPAMVEDMTAGDGEVADASGDGN